MVFCFIGLIRRLPYLEYMKSGPLHYLQDELDESNALLGHVPNQKVQTALEVIPNLPCLLKVACFRFASAASSPLSRRCLFERFHYTGHGRIVGSKLFHDATVGLA